MAMWQVSKYLSNLAMIKDLRKWIYLLLESSEQSNARHVKEQSSSLQQEYHTSVLML